MVCKHCRQSVSGEAQIVGDSVWHRDCHKPWKEAQAGRRFPCPKCGATGWEYNRDVPETYLHDPSDGYNGYHCNLETRVRMRHEQKRCEFCDGHGYLAKEPQPIIEPAKVVGWQK